MSNIGWTKYTLNHDFLDELTPQSAWWLGLMAADGCVGKDTSEVSISQSGDDGLQMVEYIKGILSCTHPIYHNRTKCKTSHELRFASPKIRQRLIDFGITPNKSLTLQFPNVPSDILAPFVRGYVDGDGSVSFGKTGRSIMYRLSLVGTRDFADGLCQAVAVKPNDFRQLVRARNCWELRWHGRNAVALAMWLYDDDVGLYWSRKSVVIQDYLRQSPPPYIEWDWLCWQALNRVKNGERVADIANDMGLHFQQIYKWIKKPRHDPLMIVVPDMWGNPWFSLQEEA